MKAITQIQTHTGKYGLATTSRATIRQNASASDGGLGLGLHHCENRPTEDCCNAFPQFFKVWERKFHGAKSSCTFRSKGTNVPGNESSTGTKVPSVDFSLTRTKVQRNEKSRCHISDSDSKFLIGNRLTKIGRTF